MAPITPYRTAWNAYMNGLKFGADDIDERRADLAVSSIARRVARMFEDQPPLSDAQIETLADHLREVARSQR
jgi:hypothetical protein